ncbi:tsr1322 [Thermosynechococcus vestitus BP-1]|uniref:Tsr1322 protein n=1 Tax=Thermosynechococcus vestitus (strain NIES-2133 / IAM M-273 / BP-1) TaxID=197221 RepID=Q8DJA5_THEVB|nr:tsr1322 [Thermosynechococcus vestitus BP-1]
MKLRLILLPLIRNLEPMADHGTTISQRVCFIVGGGRPLGKIDVLCSLWA